MANINTLQEIAKSCLIAFEAQAFLKAELRRFRLLIRMGAQDPTVLRAAVQLRIAIRQYDLLCQQRSMSKESMLRVSFKRLPAVMTMPSQASAINMRVL